MPKDYIVVDEVEITDDGLIRMGGATTGRLVVEDGQAYIEHKDRNRDRSLRQRGGVRLTRIKVRDYIDSLEDYLGSAVV